MRNFLWISLFLSFVSCMGDAPPKEEEDEVVIETLDDLVQHALDTMPSKLPVRGKCPDVVDTIKYPLPDFADDSLKSLKWTVLKPVTIGSTKLAEAEQFYYAFNEDLQLTAQFEIRNKDTLKIINKYYNTLGLVERTEKQDFESDLNEIAQYHYYEQCNLLRMKVDEEDERITCYYYDRRGRLVETIAVRMDKLSEHIKVEYKYKPRSNFVTEKITYIDGEFMGLETFEESDNGNQIRETIDGENVFKEFDSYGNVKFKKIQWGPLTEYFYTYDKRGNWTKREEVEEGVLLSVEKREIVYYEEEPAMQ